ncbi:DNA pilot protein [Dipodfec virus UOA04_Rod_765]|nr:DNA pilot protein [Dipodfec virus UOA04_Rod_765]
MLNLSIPTTDNSSGAVPSNSPGIAPGNPYANIEVGSVQGASSYTDPYGNTYDIGDTNRGFGHSFNKTAIEQENFKRDQISAVLEHNRELDLMQRQQDYNDRVRSEDNKFNSEQAKLKYERDREFRQTAYQDTMKDLKEAGLNPILAYAQGPSAGGNSAYASAAGGTSSTRGGASRGSYRASENTDPLLTLVNGLVSIASKAIGGGKNK